MVKRTVRSSVIMVVTFLVVLSGFFVATGVTHAASYCQVAYTVTSQWSGGFGATITIQNTSGSAWSSWSLQFAFPASGQTVTQGWNGTFSQSGQNVTVTNASYNGSVAANASVSPGFNGAWTTSNPAPTSFSVNGNACNGSGGTTPTPGTTPTATPGTTPTVTPGTTPTPTATPGNGTCPTSTAPATSFALGHRTLNYARGSDRPLPTDVWYPRAGSGGTVENAPLASGTFPLILFSHGFGGNPPSYSTVILPMAQAGFIVAAPLYPYTHYGSSGNGNDIPNQPLDASYVITQVLALNTTPGDLFNGHIRTTCGIGAEGHSAGAGTTDGLLSLHRDPRVTAAVELATFSLGTPANPPAKVLIIHGTKDQYIAYSSAQTVYNGYGSWPKAFLTEIGGTHDDYVFLSGPCAPTCGHGYTQALATSIDWMRYALYGDTAARDRLPTDATSSITSFTSSGL